MRSKPKNLTKKLLQRGDRIYVDNGRITVEPVSGNQVPRAWLKKHFDQMSKEIAVMMELECCLKYIEYSTGHYSSIKSTKKFPGLTMQFLDVVHNQSFYTIFNVQLTYTRNGKSFKKGDILPNGHFRVGKRTNFNKLWLQTGLCPPRHLSSFHDYMGGLKYVLFSLKEPKKSNKTKILSNNITTLCVSYKSLLSTAYNEFNPVNSRRIYGESAESSRTVFSDKKPSINQYLSNIEEDQSTGAINYVNKLIRRKG